ncbi:uncharacterized protein B0H18DRAFT_74533 [Fomitopsis serialis]|uniref:uncharacterized protein n=1 Tax=Fomitopsis serialis TaxID=139415 RepID=UPI002007E9F7|nr:uncharacterized protein B0H18DRAFT_74533 [Neoantrodia serialis]KAH9916192.1 hypothetical protein B0H18DRAFT_74533 [Neoantrodia serialis]
MTPEVLAPDHETQEGNNDADVSPLLRAAPGFNECMRLYEEHAEEAVGMQHVSVSPMLLPWVSMGSSGSPSNAGESAGPSNLESTTSPLVPSHELPPPSAELPQTRRVSRRPIRVPALSASLTTRLRTAASMPGVSATSTSCFLEYLGYDNPLACLPKCFPPGAINLGGRLCHHPPPTLQCRVDHRIRALFRLPLASGGSPQILR